MFNTGDMVEVWIDDRFTGFYSHEFVDSVGKDRGKYKMISLFIMGKVSSNKDGVCYKVFHRHPTDDNMNFYEDIKESEFHCQSGYGIAGRTVNHTKYYNNIPNYIYGERPNSFDNHIVKLNIARDVSSKNYRRYGDIVNYQDVDTDEFVNAKIIGSYIWMFDVDRGLVDGEIEYVVQYENSSGVTLEDNVCEKFLNKMN